MTVRDLWNANGDYGLITELKIRECVTFNGIETKKVFNGRWQQIPEYIKESEVECFCGNVIIVRRNKWQSKRAMPVCHDWPRGTDDDRPERN